MSGGAARVGAVTDPSDTARGLKQWATAWDVEAATKRFYDAYEEVFRQVESLVTGVQDVETTNANLGEQYDEGTAEFR